MSRQIFVNLPVKDLPRTMAFFRALKFEFNMQWTDETAACMVIGENIHAMLLTEKKFSEFTSKAICDAHKQTEVLICITCESKEALQQMVSEAVAQGGRTVREPEDHGFMYGHAFEDLDGHIWEVVYFPPQQTE